MMLEFEWDEAKRRMNIEKHKIDFADAIAIFDDYVCTLPSVNRDYGEERYLAIGLLRGLEIVVVYTPRGNRRRIISARRARIKEKGKYHEERNRAKN